MAEKQTFRATLLQSGKTATGIEVPPAVVDGLGADKKPAVTVTLNGNHSYRTSVGSMGGKFMLPVSGEQRAAAGVAAGDELDVTLERDTAPRTVDVPQDFQAALDADTTAKAFFEGLAYSHRLRHVLAINDAKTPETRTRRIEKAVETLRAGKK
jgi:hypothetical protein